YQSTHGVLLGSFLLLLMVTFFFSACKEEEGYKILRRDAGNPGCALALGIDSSYVSNNGAKRESAFTAKENWDAKTNADWINISNTQGNEGDNTLNLTIDENAGNPRSAAIELTTNSGDFSKNIIIVQDSLVGTPTIEV